MDRLLVNPLYDPAFRVIEPFGSMCGVSVAVQAHYKSENRLVFIDGLRVAAIVLVIIHHAAQAYEPTGGFWPVHDRAQSGWFAPFYTANGAFGMGSMFFLAGYFVPPSYDRKGPRLFLKGRWLRIGIPLASFVLLLHFPAVYLLAGRPPLKPFLEELYQRGWQPIYLHLWFVAHLVMYCLIYTAWRQMSALLGIAPREVPLASFAAIASFMSALALIRWLVRIWYPIDKWAPFLWIIPAEPAHLPQYMALFAAGVMAYRGGWFDKMPRAEGLIWLAVGGIASSSIYVAYAVGWWKMAPGGLGMESLLRSSWETVIAVGLSIGLIVAFREFFDRPNRFLDAMAAASFGAYILHPAIVVSLQAAMADAKLTASIKFSVVSVLGTVAAFAAAHAGGRVPVLGTMLGAASDRKASLPPGVERPKFRNDEVENV